MAFDKVSELDHGLSGRLGGGLEEVLGHRSASGEVAAPECLRPVLLERPYEKVG